MNKLKGALHKFLNKPTNLNRQLRILIIAVGVPFIIMVAIMVGMLWSFNYQYKATLQNATKAGEFSLDFKSNLDLQMYYYVVGSRNIDHLPLEYVDQSEQVLQSLALTTTQKDNQWRIKSLIRLCERLRECMYEIEKTTSYDSRMQQLEHNIYLITDLMQTYVHEYIYDEVNALSQLQKEVGEKIGTAIVTTAIVSAFLLLFMIAYSMRLTQSISKPILKLCKKVDRLGTGDFTVVPVETSNEEIKTLDDGFNTMVLQINSLLIRAKADEKALYKAGLELLQAQINPHFLYNTFDSIIWLAEAGRTDEVVQMTTSLSSFFRSSLANGKNIITLKTEVEHVESYLKIQQLRYRDILNYEINVPEELLETKLPKLTLQPLVENALYHGVKNKRGMGTITITGKEEQGKIILCVQDNGAGMSHEQLENLRAGIYTDRHTGLGLVNVHKRLQLYFGNTYGLKFASTLGIGTMVTVSISKQNQLLS